MTATPGAVVRRAVTGLVVAALAVAPFEIRWLRGGFLDLPVRR